jgi:hypothetical protein
MPRQEDPDRKDDEREPEPDYDELDEEMIEDEIDEEMIEDEIERGRVDAGEIEHAGKSRRIGEDEDDDDLGWQRRERHSGDVDSRR